MQDLLYIPCNLSDKEKADFSKIIDLLNCIPPQLLNKELSYFLNVDKYKEPIFEIVLVSKDGLRSKQSFYFELVEPWVSIYFSIEDWLGVELCARGTADEIFFTFLYEKVSRLLKSSIKGEITLVNGVKKTGVYKFSKDEDVFGFRNGIIWFWNKKVKSVKHYEPWILEND